MPRAPRDPARRGLNQRSFLMCVSRVFKHPAPVVLLGSPQQTSAATYSSTAGFVPIDRGGVSVPPLPRAPCASRVARASIAPQKPRPVCAAREQARLRARAPFLAIDGPSAGRRAAIGGRAGSRRAPPQRARGRPEREETPRVRRLRLGSTEASRLPPRRIHLRSSRLPPRERLRAPTSRRSPAICGASWLGARPRQVLVNWPS